ncbi:MAG: hypothetical protein ACYCXR_06915 [Coriobacteriia bacterium]
MNERTTQPVRVVEMSLYHLAGAERGAAIDALSSGAELPLVIADGRVVCTGALDFEAIASALPQTEEAG